MSYTPTQWKDGDLVTSAKLNKLEQGVANGGGIMVIHEDENGILDKTWQEIYNGGFGVIMAEMPDSFLMYAPITQIFNNGNNLFSIVTIGVTSEGVGAVLYQTQSSNGYPVEQSPNNR